MKKDPAMKMKKAPVKMAKKSPAKKPSDLEVGNRKNLPADLKASIAAAKMKKESMATLKKSMATLKKSMAALKKEEKSAMMMKSMAKMGHKK